MLATLVVIFAMEISRWWLLHEDRTRLLCEFCRLECRLALLFAPLIRASAAALEGDSVTSLHGDDSVWVRRSALRLYIYKKRKSSQINNILLPYLSKQ